MAAKELDSNSYSAKPFQLRPSALSSSNNQSGNSLLSGQEQPAKAFILRPSALTAIADKIDIGDERKRPKHTGNESDDENEDGKTKRPKVSDSDDEKLVLTEPIQKPSGIGTFGFGKEQAINGTTNGTSGSESSEKDQSDSSCGFVFGQNIASRVTGFKDLPSAPEQKDTSEEDNKGVSDTDKERLLIEAADEHMQNISKNKQHLQEVETFTGEEGERNVLVIQCKLHLFDSVKKVWCEKGRGTIKLNDICQSEQYDVFQSRLVFRTHGSHLVVFNTKLWPQMKCEKANEKGIRLTALDADAKEVKIFLISAPSKDVQQLFTAIDRRIQALKRGQESQISSVDESCDSNDNDSPVADDEDSQSEDAISSPSYSLDQTHQGEGQEEEQSNESYSDNTERTGSAQDHKEREADDAGT